MDIKAEVKEESYFLNFCSENETELFTKNVGDIVNSEIVTSGSDYHIDIKAEIEEEAEVSHLGSLDQRELSSEDSIMGYNKNEIDNRIEIKEEQSWFQRSSSTPSSYDIKDRAEDFRSLESPGLKKEDVSSYKPELFYSEDLGNHKSFNMRKGTSESTSARKCHSQKRVCSETPDGEKIVGIPSCLKQNNMLQQSNTSKEDINRDICKSILTNAYKKAYKCNICNNTFTMLQNLKRHKFIHEGRQSHKCNICNKSFTQLQNLKTHKLIHEGVKPHKCNICNKAFNQLKNLKTHQLIHDGVKPHLCNICNKAFTQLQHLKMHKLVHEGSKPHKCNICNKAFTRSSTLRTHKLMHEGIRPHKCNSCKKAFTRPSALKRHTLIHEDIKAHKCNICNKAFTQLSTLKRHKFIHEGITQQA